MTYTDPPTLEDTSEGPPEYRPDEEQGDGLQPPPDLDNLHAPDHVNVTCAECGLLHVAVLERYTPLGAESSDAEPKVELRYRMPPCTRTGAQPSTGPTPEPTLEGSPRVWRDEEDGTP